MPRAAIAGALLALAFLAGWIGNGWRLGQKMEAERLAHQQALAAALEAVREEDNRRTNALVETINAASADLARALADRDRARAAAGGLQQRAEALAASCRGAAPAGPGPAAPGAGDMLADMLRRIDGAAGEIAAHADRAMIAARACERAYDSLGK